MVNCLFLDSPSCILFSSSLQYTFTVLSEFSSSEVIHTHTHAYTYWFWSCNYIDRYKFTLTIKISITAIGLKNLKNFSFLFLFFFCWEDLVTINGERWLVITYTVLSVAGGILHRTHQLLTNVLYTPHLQNSFWCRCIYIDFMKRL